MRRVKRPPKATIPNSFTVLNMFLGFSAIIFALEGKIETGIWLIYFATFMDLLDGRIATALKATSDFGAEFDSLTDLVTFGMAPSILIYEAYFQQWGYPGVLISFSHVCFTAMRLARFNVVDVKSTFFQGVPSPVGALLVVGYIGFAQELWGSYAYPQLAMLVVLITSFLMISNIPFESNVIDNKRKFSQTWKIIPFALSILSVIIFGAGAIFGWMAFYVGVGVGRWFICQVTDRDLPLTI